MQLSNLMPFPKAARSSAPEGPHSEDVKAFKDAAWHQTWLKTHEIWVHGFHLEVHLEISLGTYWEARRVSKKNLS